MKLFLLSLALLSVIASSARGANYCYRIDTSVTNITSLFSATNSRLTPAALMQVKTFMAVNGTATEIQVNCAQSSGMGYVSPPSVNSAQNFSIAASEAWIPPDTTGMGNACFVRSIGATISSGIIRLCLIGSGTVNVPY